METTEASAPSAAQARPLHLLQVPCFASGAWLSGFKKGSTLKGQAKKVYRQPKAVPAAANFFARVQKLLDSQGFLPSNPLRSLLHPVDEMRKKLPSQENGA